MFSGLLITSFGAIKITKVGSHYMSKSSASQKTNYIIEFMSSSPTSLQPLLLEPFGKFLKFHYQAEASQFSMLISLFPHVDPYLD